MSWQDVLKTTEYPKGSKLRDRLSDEINRAIDERKAELPKIYGKRRIAQEYADEREKYLGEVLTGFGTIEPEDMNEYDREDFIKALAFIEYVREQPPVKRRKKKEKPKEVPKAKDFDFKDFFGA